MNTYRVTYDFVVDAESEDDAVTEANQLIQAGYEPEINVWLEED